MANVIDLLDPAVNGHAELLKKNQFHPDNPADGTYAIALKNHILRIAKALTSNASDLIPLQAALAAHNPGPIGTGRIINPAFPFGAPPGAVGVLPVHSDVPPGNFSVGLPFFDEKKDFLKRDSLEKSRKLAELNLYTEQDNAADNFYEATMTVEQNGVAVDVVDFSKLFIEQRAGFDFGNGERGYKSYKPKTEARQKKTQERLRRERAIEFSDSFFSPSDLEKGFVEEDEFTADGIEDSTNYLPFFFEDLRQPSGSKRRIYFRAFFKGLRESIAPKWTQEDYFGRVDPVGTYTGTSRTVSVTFAVVSMSPQGFTAMWRKLNQFSKLLYPTIRNGVMVKSPTCRMRIGDLICDEFGNGLTGYISSPLELDYSDSIWEISEWISFNPQKEFGKAPQMAVCSFTFQVIHETNPKLDENGNFDTTFFRRVGRLSEVQEEIPAEDSVLPSSISTGD